MTGVEVAHNSRGGSGITSAAVKQIVQKKSETCPLNQNPQNLDYITYRDNITDYRMYKTNLFKSTNSVTMMSSEPGSVHSPNQYDSEIELEPKRETGTRIT